MVSPEVKKYLEDEIQKGVSFGELRKKFTELLSREPFFQFAEFDVIKKFLARKQWSAEEISEILKEINAMEEKYLEEERIKLQEKRMLEEEMKAKEEKAADAERISGLKGEVISKEVLVKKAELKEIEKRRAEEERENKLKTQLEAIERTQKELFQKEVSRAISAEKEEPLAKETPKIIEEKIKEKVETAVPTEEESPEIVIPAAFIKREVPPKKPFFTRIKSRFSGVKSKIHNFTLVLRLVLRQFGGKRILSRNRRENLRETDAKKSFLRLLLNKFIFAVFVKSAIFAKNTLFVKKSKALGLVSEKKVSAGREKEGKARFYAGVPEKPPEKFVEKSKEKISLLETKIIGKWLAGAGTAIFIFGVAMFLKYILENNFVGIAERILFGVMAGFIFLFIGDFLSANAKYSRYAFFVSGSGLIIACFSIYASFGIYNLVSQIPAFFLMFITAVLGILFSLKSNGRILAVISLICALSAPVLASMDGGQLFLFNYILILNFIFLVLNYVKRWKFIFVLEPLLTYPLFYWWLMKFYGPETFMPAAFFLNIFFLFFFAFIFFLNFAKEKKFSVSDAAIGVLNVIFYFPAACYILEPYNNIFIGALFAVWSAVYLFCAYLIYKINPENKKAILFFAGAGMLLLALFVSVQFSGMLSVEILTIGSLILIWLGFQFKNFQIRIFANLLLLFAVIYLLLFEISAKEPIGRLLFINERILLFLFMAIALFLAACFYKQRANAQKKGEEHISKILDAAANLILISILSLESINFFDKMAGNIESGNEYYSSIKNLRNLSLSALWGVYSAVLMTTGILRNYKILRTLSLIGFGAVVAKALLYDIFWLSNWFKIGLFVVLGLALLVFSFLYRRKFNKLNA